ncbi:hypothetical protein ACA910_019980 [Epithemia clementina (nom. ined.)]
MVFSPFNGSGGDPQMQIRRRLTPLSKAERAQPGFELSVLPRKMLATDKAPSSAFIDSSFQGQIMNFAHTQQLLELSPSGKIEAPPGIPVNESIRSLSLSTFEQHHQERDRHHQKVESGNYDYLSFVWYGLFIVVLPAVSLGTAIILANQIVQRWIADDDRLYKLDYDYDAAAGSNSHNSNGGCRSCASDWTGDPFFDL